MRTKLILGLCIGWAWALGGCGAAESQKEPVAEQKLALDPCDPSAPFGAPVRLIPREEDYDFITVNYDGLTFSDDGNTIYLSSPHQEGTSFDILRADKDGSGNFEEPEVITPLSAENIDDRAPQLSPDGQKLYFHRINGAYNDIMVAELDGGEFDNATSIGFAINTSLHDQDPFPSEADGFLYFASERGVGNTIKDIYYLDDEEDIVALPAGTSAINHPTADDYRPVLTDDGLTLYFASKRSGIGGDTDGDIWMATRANLNSSFGTPTRVDILNRSGRDFPLAVSEDECTLYFASNRDTGLGSTDDYRIYTATRMTSTPSTVTLTLEIEGTGSVTTSPFNCSHTGSGTGGTGTCSAALAPGTVQQIDASGLSEWSGSCTGFTSPDSNGLGIWADGGVCHIKIL